MRKKILVFLVITIVTSILVHIITYIFYLMNIDFISANISALPMNYRVLLGYGQHTWWAYLLSLAAGALSALTCFIDARRR